MTYGNHFTSQEAYPVIFAADHAGNFAVLLCWPSPGRGCPKGDSHPNTYRHLDTHPRTIYNQFTYTDAHTNGQPNYI